MTKKLFISGERLQLPELWGVVDDDRRGVTLGIGDSSDGGLSEVWFTYEEAVELQKWLDKVMYE